MGMIPLLIGRTLTDKTLTTLGIPPLPLSAEQTSELCELLKKSPIYEKEALLDLLRDRVPPGVDQAAYVKAVFCPGLLGVKLPVR